jgi:DNA transformation protein and related proteins
LSFDAGLFDWVTEAMAPIGSVTKRMMMGGATLYCDGVIFAILDDDQLWFKADTQSDGIWDAAACPRFTFDMGGKQGSMNYRRAPDDVYDDAEVLQRWALLALEAGHRVPPKKPKKKA